MNMLNTFRRDNSITSDKDTNNNDKYNERVHTQPFECINGVVVWLHSAVFFYLTIEHCTIFDLKAKFYV